MMMIKITICMLLLTLGSTLVDSAEYSFLSIGDWGAAGAGEPFRTNVNKVAKAMAKEAENRSAKFVINTGDNFYWCGIT
jgi:hypothetical protein